MASAGGWRDVGLDDPTDLPDPTCSFRPTRSTRLQSSLFGSRDWGGPWAQFDYEYPYDYFHDYYNYYDHHPYYYNYAKVAFHCWQTEP